MRLSPSLALPALLLPLLCAACSPSPVPVPVRLVVPPQLLTCQPQPVPPNPLRDDADLAYFITDLAAAGDDCRAKLAGVRGLIEQQGVSP